MSGFPRDNEQTNVSSSESALLERLMGGDNALTPQPAPAPAQATQQPQQVCHLQVTLLILTLPDYRFTTLCPCVVGYHMLR